MTQLMMIWISTVALLAVALTVRALYRFSMHGHSSTHHIIELEKEAKLIYCPGDIVDNEDSDDL